ncbi:hypothetical protein KIN20_017354 [Parelaphostrongylus tenuis]|uniref:Uncharacterized protein n=1 Tax=Parelaphostrongylus tenuis TaxID=148309 RepID=A0AAD5QTR0_PARTN|nr:hypothetical protein KIN20_017354 [Parelaphostrongylus tenuis]
MIVHKILIGLPTNPIMISLLVSISTVVGCGVMPAGQASNRTFTVTGFTTLLVAMVYTSATNAVRFSGIATTEEGAKMFVQRLVMQTRSPARAVISAILSQLTVDIRLHANELPNGYWPRRDA